VELLIDGYNLLHVTGVFAKKVGPGSLEQLHAAFLEVLAARLGAEQAARTTVVFDAKGRKATQRRALQHAGIQVRYAARHETADNYIVELLQASHAPRQMVVVSSDHLVQRAARRRRAKAVDSGAWYAELLRKSSQPAKTQDRTDKPEPPLSRQETARWLSEFGPVRLDEAATPPVVENPFSPEYLAEIAAEVEDDNAKGT
jgi:predicted RNA-binding protein with PIN domain